ncbi:uncharacterized protein RCH25_006485 [Pelodytes ibericus]
MNKEKDHASENGRVKKLICITQNDSFCRHEMTRTLNSSEEKVNTPMEPCDIKENVYKTSGPTVPVIQKAKNASYDNEDGGVSTDLIENYKNAIAKLRDQSTRKPSATPSQSVARSSFHGHIQTCILQLYNGRPKQQTNLITCGHNNSLIKSPSGKGKRFEGPVQRFSSKCRQMPISISPVITMNKASKAEREKFVWSQNHQDPSKAVWAFPAFHPQPLKMPFHNYSYSLRTQTRSGKKNQSTARHISSSHSQLREIPDTGKDPVPFGSQVTLGLMLDVIRKGLRQNQIRTMLVHTNRQVSPKINRNKNPLVLRTQTMVAQLRTSLTSQLIMILPVTFEWPLTDRNNALDSVPTVVGIFNHLTKDDQTSLSANNLGLQDFIPVVGRSISYLVYEAEHPWLIDDMEF